MSDDYSASEFLKKLSLSNDEWYNEKDQCCWIFRGQNNSAYWGPEHYQSKCRQSAYNLLNIIRIMPGKNSECST